MAVIATYTFLAVYVYDLQNKVGVCNRNLYFVGSQSVLLFTGKEGTSIAASPGAQTRKGKKMLPLARIWGECSTIRSLSVLFFSLFFFF